MKRLLTLFATSLCLALSAPLFAQGTSSEGEATSDQPSKDPDGGRGAENPEPDEEADPADADVTEPGSADQQPETEKAEPREPVDVSFFLLGNIRGNFADVSCRDPDRRPGAMHYARQVTHYRNLTSSRSETGKSPPIALNVGDSTFPGPLGRFLLGGIGGGGQTLTKLLGIIPWAAHAFGNRELGIARPQLNRLAEGALDTDLPFQAANLTCTPEGGAEVICEAVGTGPNGQRWSVVERSGLDIGVVSVLDPEADKTVAPARMSGLDLLDPTLMLPDVIDTMREQAAVDFVVVLYHSSNGDVDLKVRHLAETVEGIDLLVTNESIAIEERRAEDDPDPHTGGYIVTPGTGTYIVSADTGPRRVVEATARLARDGTEIAGMETVTHSTSNLEADPAAARELESITASYCDNWGSAIGSGSSLEASWTLDDFQTFVLNVMRFSTQAEVALSNKGAFRNSWRFPLEDQLTLADVYSVLPFQNDLVTFSMEGADLESLADKIDDGLLAAGLDKKDETVTVNGRPIKSSRTYRIAANEFVATGGDGYLDPETVQQKSTYDPDWSTDPPAVTDIIIHWVREGMGRWSKTTDELSPTESFPDLREKLLWNFTGSIDASYNQVAVSNPTVDGQPAYGQSQLTVNSTDQINLEGNAVANADSEQHGWDNNLLLQYAQARVDTGDDTQFEQTKDLIRLKSLYKYAGFRKGRWYVPMPYAEGQGESEFDRPDEREWHKLEVTGIVGLDFQLLDPLEVKVGGNVRRDLNQPQGVTTVGVTGGLTLQRVDLIGILGHPVQFETDLEYFYNSIDIDNIQELRARARIYYAFVDRLFFSTTFQAFAYRTDPVGQWGTNTEITIGLNYLWDASVQTF